MGWRSKFVFLLIVYCAGFATAIYCLAPTPKSEPGQTLHTAQLLSAVKSQDLLKSFNSGMYKCLGFSREATQEAAKLLQAKLEEALQAQSKE
jgi:hypothetical protein